MAEAECGERSVRPLLHLLVLRRAGVFEFRLARLFRPWLRLMRGRRAFRSRGTLLEFALRCVRVERRLAAMRFLVLAWRLVAGPRQVGRTLQPLHNDIALQFAVGPDRGEKTVGPVGRDLHEGFFRLHLDGADLALADAA